MRPRFGVMRGREFLMKDAYSFDLDKDAARHAYNRMFTAYLRTFARLGVKAIPMKADTGPIGGDLSHEFIVLASTGESEVFCHSDYLNFETPAADTDFDSVAGLQGVFDKWTSLYAATEEMHDKAAFEAVPEDKRVSARGIEVGHIFYFGTKYSEPMGASVTGPDGQQVLLHGGSPRGAELIASKWASNRKVAQIAFKPDWTRHAKAAPFKRNDQMLDVLPIGVIVFPGSGIQENLADKARKLGIPVWKFGNGGA